MPAQKYILIGMSGGIAAGFYMPDVLQQLKNAGHKIKVILTASARRLVDFEELSRLSDSIHTELFPPDFNYLEAMNSRQVLHLDLARGADLFLIAPATANIIAKLAHGIADDLLTTTALAVRAPIIFCPSMEEDMWFNHAVQENVRILEKRGYKRLGPVRGPLVGRGFGDGSMASPQMILNELEKLL